MNHSPSIPLPAIPTDANIYRPLPARSLPPWVYFLGVLILVTPWLATNSLVLAVFVALFALLASRYVHHRAKEGDDRWRKADVWRPAPPPAPAWLVFAHQLRLKWSDGTPPEALERFEGAVLEKIIVSRAGFHLWISGNGNELDAARNSFAAHLGAEWLSPESVNAQGVVWLYPSPTEAPEVQAARRVLETAGFTNASKGLIETISGGPDDLAWSFKAQERTLTAAALTNTKDRLLAATRGRFAHLVITDIAPGTYTLRFEHSPPPSPLDLPLASPHQGR